jgi:hypothetical protein
MPQQGIPPPYTSIHTQQIGTHGVPNHLAYTIINDPHMATFETCLMGLEKTVQNSNMSCTKLEVSYDLKIYPFDTKLYMPPFPPGYVSPNFTKYQGKTNPIEHIREFSTNYIDIAYEPTYLMRLFPKSLAGPALEWFSNQQDI